MIHEGFLITSKMDYMLGTALIEGSREKFFFLTRALPIGNTTVTI